MQIILACAYCALFIYFIRKIKFFQSEEIPTSWPIFLFLLKVIAGVLLGLIYTYHYTDIKTTDTWKFFNDSKIMFSAMHEHPYDFFRMFTGFDGDSIELRSYYERMDAWLNTNLLFNDNKTIIRLNAFFHFFSLGYYYVHVIFMNCLSFTGLFCLYKVFNQLVKNASKEILLFTFLFPSVLFWGSGLLKDSLLIFGLGLFIYQFYRFTVEGMKTKRILLLLLSIGLLSVIKFYILILILPGIIGWLLSKKFAPKKSLSLIAILYILFFTIAFNFHYLAPEYDLSAILYWKQFNFYGYANAVESKSLIEIPRLGLTPWSIIKNVPSAFFTTLVRPFLTDIHQNPLILLAAIENLLILCFLAFMVFTFKKPDESNRGFFWVSIFFIITLFALIGLTTPVLGAIVRYKIPALPFLGFIILSLTRKRIFN